jgi:hypothetical protein
MHNQTHHLLGLLCPGPAMRHGRALCVQAHAYAGSYRCGCSIGFAELAATVSAWRCCAKGARTVRFVVRMRGPCNLHRGGCRLMATASARRCCIRGGGCSNDCSNDNMRHGTVKVWGCCAKGARMGALYTFGACLYNPSRYIAHSCPGRFMQPSYCIYTPLQGRLQDWWERVALWWFAAWTGPLRTRAATLGCAYVCREGVVLFGEGRWHNPWCVSRWG